ncbi:calumenin-like [Glandiceps talaboti]
MTSLRHLLTIATTQSIPTVIFINWNMMLRQVVAIVTLLYLVSFTCTTTTKNSSTPIGDKDTETIPPLEYEDLDVDFDELFGIESQDVLDKTQTKKRLEKIFRMMDVDESKRLDKNEMKDWIYKTIVAMYRMKSEEGFELIDSAGDGDGKLSWDETVTFMYRNEGPMAHIDFAKEIIQDKKRFDAADADSDQVLSKKEFFVFEHPELYDNMKEFIAWKFFDDFDKNSDGSVESEEYIGKIYPDLIRDDDDEYDDDDDDDDDESLEEKAAKVLEDWKRRFEMIDANSDGRLSVPEVLDIMLPSLHRSAAYGAKLIMGQVDDNKDGKLSVAEVRKNFKVFTENKEVDFNTQIRRIKDEL